MTAPKYSNIWFNPNAFVCLETFRGKDNVSFLEIGAFEGFGTNYFLERFLTGRNCTITCIDPWIKYSEATVACIKGWDDVINENTFDVFQRNTKAHAERIVIHRGLSKDILPKLDERFHFVYIDGDHSEDAVRLDATMSFAKLHVGGFMVFDDYDWNVGKKSPKKAIDRFLHEYRFRIKYRFVGNQVVVEKIKEKAR